MRLTFITFALCAVSCIRCIVYDTVSKTNYIMTTKLISLCSVALFLGGAVVAGAQAPQVPDAAADTVAAASDGVERLSIPVADGITIEVVYIPGGTFSMGATAEQAAVAADDEKPVHQVTLSPYYIATTECTQALWQAVMGYNTSVTRGDNLPVTNVNVYDCHEFIRKLSQKTGYTFRLPTEAEWEYAARGGMRSNATLYCGSNDLAAVAWNADNASAPQPVAGKAPNELGLYDMSGNVYEICEDEYAAYSSAPQTDPKGGASDQQVFRGGGYISPASDCRTSVRSFAPTDYKDAFIGFRLAVDAD